MLGTASGGDPAVFSLLSPLAVPLLYQAPLRVLGADHPQTKIVRGNLAAARQHPQ